MATILSRGRRVKLRNKALYCGYECLIWTSFPLIVTYCVPCYYHKSIAHENEVHSAWWLHQMETFSALPALCKWNALVTGGFPLQRPVTRSFDGFFICAWLSKQPRRRCFETPSHSLWRHCNGHPLSYQPIYVIQSPHDGVIKWKHFPCYWPFVRGIHRSPVNSPHKGRWRGALMFSLICVWINGWVNNREAGDLRRYCAHYNVIVIMSPSSSLLSHMQVTLLLGS